MSVNSNNPKSNHTNPNLPDLMPNTPVSTEVKGNIVEGLFSHWTKQNEAYIKLAGRQPIWRAFGKFQVTGEAIAEGAGEAFLSSTSITGEVNVREFKPAKQFNINKRFSFLASLVKMVIKEQSVSAIITGDGGLGKTKTVMDQVEINGLVEGVDYISVKGYSTAKGLYNTLYMHQDKLVIFDDCDEVLKNDIARNILKGALDSYDKRIVHWISNKESDIPNEFEFTGRVIFISNMKRHQIHQAIISRSTCVDVSMTIDEKIERMRTVLPMVKQRVSMEIKEEALSIVEKWKHETSDLNFRTLIKVINIRTAAERNGEMEDWEEMAEYMLLS